jgi:hypothetical protein
MESESENQVNQIAETCSQLIAISILFATVKNKNTMIISAGKGRVKT